MKKVILYSTPSCAYCQMIKQWLDENKIEYEAFNVAADDEKKKELMEKTGQLAVPVVDIEGELVIGFDKDKLSELLGIK